MLLVFPFFSPIKYQYQALKMEIMSSIAPSKCKLECLFLGLSALSLISVRKAAFYGHSNGIDMEPIGPR